MRKWDAEDIEKDRERKTEKPGQYVPYVSPTRACMFGFWSTDDIILQAPLQSESAAVEKTCSQAALRSSPRLLI